ncbi:eCIS core domain-containing protein [Pseudotenacibaculum haliotis]|uniref:DUF4157 domain-containing protein n=1 Tax=Pseudotenacibaculum haliotis TaxID=1862138 RepID=A0ABW5LSL7_9FLAO
MFAAKNTATSSYHPSHTSTGTSFIQPKLNIGQAGDKYEVEADRAADQIVAKSKQPETSFVPPQPTIQKQPEGEVQKKETEESETEEVIQEKPVVDTISPLIQRKECGSEDQLQLKCAACGGAKEEVIQKKANNTFFSGTQTPSFFVQKKCNCQEENSIQKKEGNTKEGKKHLTKAYEHLKGNGSIESRLASSKGKGSKLDEHTRTEMESGFGADFSNVRVHTDSEAVGMSQELGAQAFTNGSDIYFNQGKYDPNSDQGKHLLAHELTHTIHQGASATNQVQKFELPGFVQDGLDVAGDLYDGAVDTVADGIYDVTEALGVTDEVLEAYEMAEDVYDAATEYLVKARDWLVTTAGQAARALVEALGGTMDVTEEGIIITFPETCPVPAEDFEIDIPEISQDLMAPVFVIPVIAGIIDGVITGELGGTATIDPQLSMQLGPFCLEGARMVINPLTGNFSVSGGVSATAAVSLGAEVRAGLKAGLGFTGIILAGEIPIPLDISLIAVEAGVAGLGRGIGMGRKTLEGGLGYNNGSLVMESNDQLEVGLAADLFLGAYGELSIGGFNFCRVYWEPYAWNGDIGAMFSNSTRVVIGPNPSFTKNVTASIGEFPFEDYELLLNRGGFEDDCVLEDIICWIMDTFDLYPSNNGGKWEVDGKYGAGGRLEGNVEGAPVFNRRPNDERGELDDEDAPLCRGACGPNCKTCNSHETYRYTDEETGDVWEYTNFEDCSTHEGCQQHDAGFDKALIEHGETGPLDIFLGDYHTLANFECMCTYPFGNCVSWIFGGPPSQGRMYFAESVRKLGDSENEADSELEAKIEAINVYFFDKDPEKHRLFIVIENGEAEIMMQSDEVEVEEAIDEKESSNPTEEEQGYLEIAESHRQTIDKLVELHLKKLDPGEEEIEEIADEIKEELEKLGEYLRNGGVDYFPEIPPTLVTYGMSSGKPLFVKANPLTFRPGNTVGSEPKEDPAGWGLVERYKYFEAFIDTKKPEGSGRETKIKKKDPNNPNDDVKFEETEEYAKEHNFPIYSTTNWVRFHILNDNLHGPGVFWNLLSAPKVDNRNYNTDIEEPVKKEVNKKGLEPFYFHINVVEYRNSDGKITEDHVHESVEKPEERKEIIRLYGEIPKKLQLNAGKLELNDDGEYQIPENDEGRIGEKNQTFEFTENIDVTLPKGTKIVVLLYSGSSYFTNSMHRIYLKSQRGVSNNVDELVDNFFVENPSGKPTTLVGFLEAIINALDQSSETEKITLFDKGNTEEEKNALQKHIDIWSTRKFNPAEQARLDRMQEIINDILQYRKDNSIKKDPWKLLDIGKTQYYKYKKGDAAPLPEVLAKAEEKRKEYFPDDN